MAVCVHSAAICKLNPAQTPSYLFAVPLLAVLFFLSLLRLSNLTGRQCDLHKEVSVNLHTGIVEGLSCL